MNYTDWLTQLKTLISNPPIMQTSSIFSHTFSREVWIANTTINGDGSKEKPLAAVNGNLDSVLPQLGSSFKVNLLPGIFTTVGFKLPAYSAIIGAGQGITTIKLSDNAKTNFAFPHCRIFGDANWCVLFQISDLTLDCNWAGQPDALINGNFKVDAIVVNAVKALIERVTVVNFGSNGKNYGSVGLECFPLSVFTYSSGPPYQYLDIYKDKVNVAADLSYVEIKNCRVERPNFINGGYCSAIFVQSNQPGSADRQAFGVRSNLAALVADNYINVPGGIGLGSAISEQVEFRNNIVSEATCGFNFDTGAVKNLKLIRNHFLKVNQGINVTAAAQPSANLEIRENTVLLTQPYITPGTQTSTPFFWLNYKNVSNVIAKDNFLSLLDIRLNPDDKEASKQNNIIG